MSRNFDPFLHAICEDPRDRNRWEVLADALEEDGYALGGRLRDTVLSWDDWRATGFVHPAAPATTFQRVCATLVTLDPDFGPRAGVLWEALAQADRVGRALRGR